MKVIENTSRIDSHGRRDLSASIYLQ